MSEETPRLSRREMREQGLLDAPSDGNTVFDTTELRLRRPSRKELRELAEQNAPENPTDKGGDDAGETATGVSAATEEADSTPEPEQVQHERKSVFDRFEEPSDAEQERNNSAAGNVAEADTKTSDEPVATAPETATADKPTAAVTHTQSEVGEEDSLRDRFLAMTKNNVTEAADHEQATATTTVAAPAEQVAAEDKDEDAPEESEDTLVEAPRRTWLNIIILILIAALIGYLGGSWINVTFLSEPLPGVLGNFTHLLL